MLVSLASGEEALPGLEQIDVDREIDVKLRGGMLHRPVAGLVERGEMDDVIASEGPALLLEPGESRFLAREVDILRAKGDDLAGRIQSGA